MKISFVSFPLEKNLKAQNELIEKYGNCSPEEADFIVALGYIMEYIAEKSIKKKQGWMDMEV